MITISKTPNKRNAITMNTNKYIKLWAQPHCFYCKRPADGYTTNHDNKNGNGGRPYSRCNRCDEFVCFRDCRLFLISNFVPPCRHDGLRCPATYGT